MILFRCATGESWQAVMLACKSGVDCQLSFHNRQYQNTGLATTSSYFPIIHTKGGGHGHTTRCGSDFAYLYFCSFVFLSSFLVSRKIDCKKKTKQIFTFI
jgi:hypothetical protein